MLSHVIRERTAAIHKQNYKAAWEYPDKRNAAIVLFGLNFMSEQDISFKFNETVLMVRPAKLLEDIIEYKYFAILWSSKMTKPNQTER